MLVSLVTLCILSLQVSALATKLSTKQVWDFQNNVAGPCTLLSPRMWLESLPDGAYTVLKCDFENGWTIEGKDFHLSRLKESIEALGCTCNTDEAQQVSSDAIDDLLELTAIQDENVKISYMATLLWIPVAEDIQVCAHLVGPIQPTNEEPIEVCVALGDDLPNRQPFPHAKLSSWCRTRRPLEERCLSSSVSEVILTEASTSGTVLLEGLTSNLFVIDKDDMLWTANSRVLSGYGRHQVLLCAEKLGLATETTKLLLLEHLDNWKEVFVTSTVKGIVRVARIHKKGESGELEGLWSNTAGYHQTEMLELNMLGGK